MQINPKLTFRNEKIVKSEVIIRTDSTRELSWWMKSETFFDTLLKVNKSVKVLILQLLFFSIHFLYLDKTRIGNKGRSYNIILSARGGGGEVSNDLYETGEKSTF